MATIPILVLRLEGVLQSWGEHSKWDYRDSAILPTKSGVVGLLGCALGWERDDSRLAELNHGLHMAVRADRQGTEMVDFHTVQSLQLLNAQGKLRGKKGEYGTLVTHRTYIQDACYTVVLSGEERLLCELRDSLAKPKWPIYLGRKSCVPSRPVCEGITREYQSLLEAVEKLPFTAGHTDKDCLVEWEESGGNLQIERQDVNNGRREFHTRLVSRKIIHREVSADVSQ